MPNQPEDLKQQLEAAASGKGIPALWNDPVRIAGVLSLLWCLGWLAAYLPELWGSAAAVSYAGWMLGIAVLVVPVISLLTSALFLSRASQLQRMSAALMKTSMRLVAPDETASDHIKSIAATVKAEVSQLVASAETAVESAKGFQSSVQDQVQGLQRAVAENEERIHNATGEIEKQRASLDQATRLIAIESNSLVAKIADNTGHLDGIVLRAQETLTRLEGGVRAVSGQLSHAIDEVAGKAIASSEKLQRQSVEIAGSSAETLTRLSDFQSQLTGQIGRIADLSQSLARDAKSLDGSVADMGNNVSRSIAESINLLVAAGDGAVQLVEAASRAGADEAGRKVEDLLGLIGTFEQKLRDLHRDAGQLVEQVEKSTGTVVGELDARIEKMALRVDDGAKDILRAFDNQSLQIVDHIRNAAADVAARLAEARDTAGATFGTAAQGWIDHVTQAATGLQEKLALSANQGAELLGAKGVEITARFDEAQQRAAGLYDSSVQQVTAKLEDVSAAYQTTVDRILSVIKDRVGESAAGLQARVRADIDLVSSTVAAESERLAQAVETYQASLSGTVESITEHVVTTSGALQETAGKTVESATATMSKSADHLAERLGEASARIAEQLKLTSTSLYDLLTATSSTITSHITGTADIVSREIQDTGLALAQQLDKSGNVVTERLLTGTDSVLEGFSKKGVELMTAMYAAGENLSQRAEDTIGRLNSRIEDSTRDVSERLAGMSGEYAGTFEKAISGVLDLQQNSAASALHTLDGAAAKVTEKVEESERKISAQIDAVIQNALTRIDQATSLIDRVGGDITGSITATSGKVVEAVTAMGAQVTSDTQRVSTEVIQSLTAGAGAIASLLDERSSPLTESVAKTARELTDALNAATMAFDDASLTAVKQLQERSVELNLQLESNIRELNRGIAKTATQLTERIDRTGSTVADRLDGSSKLVEAATAKVIDVQDVLADRKKLLGELLEDSARQMAEYDSAMKGYADVVRDLLATAEQKARQVSELFAEQTSSAARDLEDRIEELGSTSTNQMSLALRSAVEEQERVVTSIDQALSRAVTDCRKTMAEMRDTAHDVAKDIDLVREGLKGSVLRLPEDARRNMDDLKSLIVDQVAALEALGGVLRQQISKSVVSVPRNLAPRMAAGAAAHGPAHAAAYEEPAAHAAADEDANEERSLDADAAGEEPAAGQANLNLSSDGTEYLDQLEDSVREILLRVDALLPPNLDDRVRSGEQGVYVNRLLKGRGRILQKKLADRYAKGDLVKAHVDAYLQHFENLVDYVRKEQAGQGNVEACFASEYGHLYGILARMSGHPAASA